jgi:hypothetical protein
MEHVNTRQEERRRWCSKEDRNKVLIILPEGKAEMSYYQYGHTVSPFPNGMISVTAHNGCYAVFESTKDGYRVVPLDCPTSRISQFDFQKLLRDTDFPFEKSPHKAIEAAYNRLAEERNEKKTFGSLVRQKNALEMTGITHEAVQSYIRESYAERMPDISEEVERKRKSNEYRIKKVYEKKMRMQPRPRSSSSSSPAKKKNMIAPAAVSLPMVQSGGAQIYIQQPSAFVPLVTLQPDISASAALLIFFKSACDMQAQMRT